MDIFGHERARCRPLDNILRPITSSWIHTMRVEGLRIYQLPPEPSEWSQMSIPGAVFGTFLRPFLESIQGVFGVNGQLVEVFRLL